jgi:2-polyprenyl-6-hydroxyphenyl methylase / 3-demethylubiquinone-9 3-methyltransferase
VNINNAFLRAENRARAPWVAKKIAHHFAHKQCSVVDVGCGAGFLSNALAQYGHHVTGIDLSEESLNVAREKDVTHTVYYCNANGYALPFSPLQFEVICAMDLLEHVEEPGKMIAEASRVLKPGGLFFFHTINRNWFSWLFALKGVEWFVPNTSPDRLYRRFIKPKEMSKYLEQNLLKISEIFGLTPTLDKEFFKLVLNKIISNHFSFKIVPSLKCGYMGYAVKS